MQRNAGKIGILAKTRSKNEQPNLTTLSKLTNILFNVYFYNNELAFYQQCFHGFILDTKIIFAYHLIFYLVNNFVQNLTCIQNVQITGTFKPLNRFKGSLPYKKS